ncbi:MAG TPA: hypothetical protein VN132_07525 [Bdellovibrio sp.]|nr:hypothetical protein [Bdellovibrio sp.]
MSDLIYAAFFILGALLIYYRPISRSLGIPIYWEVGLGTIAVGAFVLHMTVTYVIQKEVEAELARQPCGPSSPQGACYNLDRSVCESAWANVDRSCRIEAEPILKERPGALMGPTINRCKARKMDQVLRFNRIKSDTAFCRAYFDYIDKPN